MTIISFGMTGLDYHPFTPQEGFLHQEGQRQHH